MVMAYSIVVDVLGKGRSALSSRECAGERKPGGKLYSAKGVVGLVRDIVINVLVADRSTRGGLC
jgi:hypothetical protein